MRLAAQLRFCRVSNHSEHGISYIMLYLSYLLGIGECSAYDLIALILGVDLVSNTSEQVVQAPGRGLEMSPLSNLSQANGMHSVTYNKAAG